MFMEDLVASGAKGLTFSRHVVGGMGVGPMRKECAWDFDSARKVFLGGEGKEVAA